MTGGMEEVAKINQAFPFATRSPATVGSPGISRLNGLAATQAMASGDGAKGLATAAIPFLGPRFREELLSPEVQREVLEMARKGVAPKTTASPEIVARITRLMQQARMRREPEGN